MGAGNAALLDTLSDSVSEVHMPDVEDVHNVCTVLRDAGQLAGQLAGQHALHWFQQHVTCLAAGSHAH